MRSMLKISVLILTLASVLVFLASCVVTLSDAQGALIFIFSIPIMATLLGLAILLARRLRTEGNSVVYISYFPKSVAAIMVAFFVFAFIPGLQKIPDAFMNSVGKVFVRASGVTPAAFFQERAAFPNVLKHALSQNQTIIFSDLDVTFAWDRVCIFGPYTNQQKAASVLGLDWNIEQHSEVHFSDSINALVFVYQGRVNKVVDLKRGIADFKTLDRCLPRNQAKFRASIDASGHHQLTLIP